MIIYKDILTGDELFTDSNKLNLVDDCLYEVSCTHVTRRHGEIVLAGANPSAEEEPEVGGGGGDNVESGLDLVLNQRLQNTSFDKAAYKTYLRTYTKALQEKWKTLGLTDEQLEEYKTKFTAAVKKVLPKLDDVEFYLGETCNPDGMVALLEYREKPDGSGEEALMLFYKHGLESEKC